MIKWIKRLFTKSKSDSLPPTENTLKLSYPLGDGDKMLWDVGTVPLHKFERVIPILGYIPNKVTLISSRPIGKRTLPTVNAIIREYGAELVKYNKELALQHTIIVTSNSKFVTFLPKGKCTLVLHEPTKKRILMRVKLDEPDLKIYTV